MQAPSADQALLVHLAEIDTAVAQARHRRATLPELAALRELGAARNAVTQELVAAQTALSDLNADQERLESDLEPARTRLQRNQARVDAGEIANPKALSSMLEELDHLRGRIAKLEDDELELMQVIEDATRSRDEITARRAEIDAKARTLIAARNQALTQLDSEIEVEQSQRSTIAARVPADLLALYEKVAARQGSGAARLSQGRCTGCHMESNAADLRRYEVTAPDEVVQCEECGRILIR